MISTKHVKTTMRMNLNIGFLEGAKSSITVNWNKILGTYWQKLKERLQMFHLIQITN